MKKEVLAGIILILCAAVIVAFFLPWAKVSASATGMAKEASRSVEGTSWGAQFGAELNKAADVVSSMGDVTVNTMVRGYQIPLMVNSEESRLAISIAEILFESAEDLDKKSWLVYLIPLLAILCGWLAFQGLKSNLMVIIMTVLAGGVGAVALYNIYTADLSSAAVKVTIGEGLWISFYSLLFVAVTGIVWLVTAKKS